MFQLKLKEHKTIGISRVKRATAIVRILQKEFDVAPERMTAAGRAEFVPVADNDSAAGRAKTEERVSLFYLN